jgi:1-acyl-sn-glycerol-3-phosphate acyltransferase
LFRKKKIDEWALNYWLLKQYARLWFNTYYRKIEVINRHKIPEDQPVILAPNHQNALMDAMLLVCKTPYQIVFLARADIFKGKRLKRFLTSINIMPIYRIRDGIDNVKKNDLVFDKTVEVLHNKLNPLCLFAEGNHGDRRRLRPLVKGLFRIAFLAQEKFGNSPGVKIVPIGIDYGHYQHFRTTLFMNVGDPIEVSDFMETYHDNPVLAINKLKDAFAAVLSKQMIDVQTEDYYDLYMNLRAIFNQQMRDILGTQEKTLAAKFRADKTMIDCLNHELEAEPDHIRQLDQMVKDYQQGLKNAGLRDWVIGRGKPSLAGLFITSLIKVVLFPVFLFGFVNNYVPYWFTAGRTKNLKDPQFFSSFKYVVGMIVFPVWYLVIAGILVFTSLPLWSILLYVLLLPVMGLFAFDYYIRLKKLIARWRFYFSNSTGEIKDLLYRRREIIHQVHHIIDRHKTTYENPR